MTPADPHPHATGLESPFGIDELFFSVTDQKGRIKSGNSVFVRVSQYSDAELLGQPHNIIRHPDMPRAVFHLLWDYVGRGQTIAAFVKNRAKNGSYYWVMATVAPVGNRYLSVRFKPSSPLLAVVEDVYRDVVAVERSLERQHAPHRAIVDASLSRLTERLHGLGFEDYGAFMHHALTTEMQSWRQALQARKAVAPGTVAGAAGGSMRIRRMLDSGRVIERHLETLVGTLSQFDELNASLGQKADFIQTLSDDIRLFSLNTALAAGRLENAATLEEVASLMRRCTMSTGDIIAALRGHMAETTGFIRGFMFEVSVAKVQAAMVNAFALELLARDDMDRVEDRIHQDVRDLAECLRERLGTLFGSIGVLERGLRKVGDTVDGLLGDLRTLGVLQVTCRVEAARIPDASDLQALFESLRDRIDSARQQVDELAEAVAGGRKAVPAQEPAIIRHLLLLTERSTGRAA